jgi:hypothetical protein
MPFTLTVSLSCLMPETLDLDRLDQRVVAVDTERRLAERSFQGRLEGSWTWLEPQPLVAARGHVSLRARPDATSAQVTEALLGESVELLDEYQGWAWVRTAHDGYLGYTQRSALSAPVEQPLTQVTALRGHLYSRPQITAPVLDVVSFGTLLPVVDPEPLHANGRSWWKIQYQGQDAYVHTAVTLPVANGTFKNLEWIQRYLGTPYVWGGRSAWGIDCSGLAGLFHGFRLPRDVDQQQAACSVVDIPQPGDLAFFPGHVGIMLDTQQVLHANATHMAVSVDVLGQEEYGMQLAADLTGFGRWKETNA